MHSNAKTTSPAPPHTAPSPLAILPAAPVNPTMGLDWLFPPVVLPEPVVDPELVPDEYAALLEAVELGYVADVALRETNEPPAM